MIEIVCTNKENQLKLISRFKRLSNIDNYLH